MTIQEFLDEIEKVFVKSGIECAQREALLLACHVLSVDQVYIFTHRDEYIDEKILLASAALINERCAGRPLAYITGSTDFCGVEITVDERVLIPRPETELLVEEVLNAVRNGQSCECILDLCTGSGCIAAALADRLPDASITASDVSLKALQLAGYNTRRFENVKTLRSDVFEKIDGSFDIIVSNPPYIAESDRSWMQREVKEHEPELALFAGEEGLDIISRIMAEVGAHLNGGGLFLMEIGEKQSEKVLKMAEKAACFSSYEIKKDLSSLDRYLLARK